MAGKGRPMNQLNKMTIGFVGGGNMAQAIIRGLIKSGHQPGAITVADPAAEQRTAILKIDDAIEVTEDNRTIAAHCKLVVLAVKPQIMPAVAAALGQQERLGGQIIISVAAGITLSSLATWFGDSAIIRVMPNQPALIGEGMSGLCASANVDAGGKAASEYLMSATGKAAWFDDEVLMDAVTAVSGSGPAYFYLVMELIADIATELGLDANTARLLSTQTALGAAEVARNRPETLAELRRQVTSPGGTTAAAIDTLEKENIRDIFRKALFAARDRSIELGKGG